MSSMITIRRASKADLDYLFRGCVEVYDILERCGNMFSLNHKSMMEILKVRLRSALSLIIVAEDDGQLCGFMTADVLKPERKFSADDVLVGKINEVYVSPEYRRHGIAHKLIAECEKWFVDAGVSVIQTETFHNNESSVRLWDGFEDYRPLVQRRYKRLR